MNSHKNKKRNEATPGEEKRGTYTYEYPRPALTADCVIFGFNDERLQILLIERGVEPYKGCWALPGGFMRMNESIEECARRELWEETNVKDVYLEQFHTFSSPGRDPRGRVVTVAFIALVRPSEYDVVGGDDANIAAWFDADELPPLAFDHAEILRTARQYLKEQLRLRPVAFRLVDEIFSVDELRKVYEAINGEKYDRRNFERKLISSETVEACESTTPSVSKRPVRRFSLSVQLIGKNVVKNEDQANSSEGSIKNLFDFIDF